MKKVDTQETCHYFVDESGDTVIFGKKKKLKVGKDNCPRFFILGLLEVKNPDELNECVEDLRREILSNPRLNQLPGVRREDKKTAEKFHAVDDPPIIRRMVIDLINNTNGLRFSCVIRDKLHVYKYIRSRQISNPEYTYQHGELYDYCVRRLFHGKLHTHKSYEIIFAKWKQSERKRELNEALQTARDRYCMKHEIISENVIDLSACYPKGVGGLQMVDYYLWALQRVYEKQDDSYFSLMANKYSLIVDINDERKNGYGTYYDKKRPLTLEGVRGRL